MAVNYERETDEVYCESVGWDFDGLTLLASHSLINKLILTYGEAAKFKYTDLYNSFDQNSLVVIVERPETDDEMANRIKTEEKHLQTNIDYEKRQYEILKAKFESK